MSRAVSKLPLLATLSVIAGGTALPGERPLFSMTAGQDRRARVQSIHDRTGWVFARCREMVDTMTDVQIEAAVRQHERQPAAPVPLRGLLQQEACDAVRSNKSSEASGGTPSRGQTVGVQVRTDGARQRVPRAQAGLPNVADLGEGERGADRAEVIGAGEHEAGR